MLLERFQVASRSPLNRSLSWEALAEPSHPLRRRHFWSPNWSKIGQKSIKKLYRIQSWFRNRFFLIFGRFLTNFGLIWAPKIAASKWVRRFCKRFPRFKWASNRYPPAKPFLNRFGTDFEPILAPKMVQKSSKNLSKIGVCIRLRFLIDFSLKILLYIKAPN